MSGTKSRPRRFWRVFSIAFLLGVGVVARAALTPLPTVKLAPTIAVAADPAAASALLDRDTTTAFAVTAPIAIELGLDAATEIRQVRVFGDAPASLTVQASAGGPWQTVYGLDALSLVSLRDGWNTIVPSATTSASGLRLEFAPLAGSPGPGVREIEIWGAAQRVTVRDGAHLLALVDGGTPPPQARAYGGNPVRIGERLRPDLAAGRGPRGGLHDQRQQHNRWSHDGTAPERRGG